MKKTNEKKVILCKGCLNSEHCSGCTYFDTSKPEARGSRYYKCAKRGVYVRGDECACSHWARG